MKKLFSILLGIFLFFLCCSFFILKKDKDPVENTLKIEEQQSNITLPEQRKNIVLNGRDFLQSQAPIGKFGGEIVISTIGDGPKTFNPCNTNDATSSSMAGLMYDGLVSTDAFTGEVRPLLAKDFKIKKNKYTIFLRKGCYWTDGKPITADDVLYTYREIVFKGLGNTATRDAMMINGQLPIINKRDDYTVEFITPTYFAPFLRQLSYPIVPKHYFKQYSDKGDSVFKAFLSPNTKPDEIISSGAFRLKEYVAAQRVVFVRNPDYYKVNIQNKQLPYLNKLVYLIVGDTNNEILKFEAGEIDTLSLHGSNVARYKAKEMQSDYKIYNLGADTGTLFVTINLSNRKNSKGTFEVSPVKQNWFRDRDFRAAIDWAVDRKGIVQNIAYGVAKPLFTAESLNSIYLNKYIKGHPKDINVAKNCLKKAGFNLKNGILYDKDNNRVEFNLYTNAGSIDRESIGVMIKQDLEELGMKVNFKPIEFNSLVNKISNTHDWDMIIIGLTGSPLEPHDGKNVWMSNGPLHLFNQRPNGYTADDRFNWERELDNIIEAGAVGKTFVERKSQYDKYQAIIYNEKPIIYLYSPVRIIAIRKRLRNIFPSKLSGLLHNLEEIYVEGNH